MKRLAELFKKRSGKSKRITSQQRRLLMEGLERREVFAAFAIGNLAVIRANEIDTNAPISVVELSKSTASQSNDAVQRIDIGLDFRISGSATSTGYLALTNDSSRLTFAAPITTNTTANVNTILSRGVGLLDATGTLTVGATYTGTSGQQARGATSVDNSAFFVADQGGFYTNGSTAASPTGNFRSVKSFGGGVFVAQASSTATAIMVSTISAASGGTVTGLPGLTNAATMQDFYLIQSGSNGSAFDVLYTVFATSATAGTISKFSLVNGSWTGNGTATTSFGGFGLAAEDNGTNAGATLYVTSGTGASTANSVLRIVDSGGHNELINLATSTTLYTAPASTTIKGISFTPAGVAAPEINVKGNNVSILDNDTTPSTTDSTDFGSLVTGAAAISRTFTIENTGAATLNLSGTPIVSISGGSNFSITTQPVGNTVAAAGSTTFVVTFASTTIGTQTATISIANDDSDENPYNFDITGIVSAAATPEINLQGNGVNIADGDNTPSTADDTDYGSRVAGTAAITRTFTIQNLGSGPLDLTGSPNVTITGSADFTVTTQPGADPVAAGSSTTFVVTFTPTTVGTQTATISIANDDSDENPYNFDVSGVVLAAIPEANVLGNGVSIVDGDTTPDSADHTVFAAAAVGGTSSRTFTIQNTGTVDLTLGAFTSSNALFTIPSPPTGPVAAGGSVTFSVVFTPTTASTATSTISFVNNDSDENPYDFVVSATGVAIEPLFISEIFFNPPGTDAPNEYVEIRGTANSAIPAGTYLVGIEGDTTGAGDVQTIFDLGGQTIGSNGFLVIRQSGNGYTVDGSATTITATGTGFQTGAGFSADTGTDIENASVTFMLVRSAIAPSLTDDIDSDNNGVADGSVFSSWSVADSVAVIDNAADAAYSNFVFSTAATFVGSSGKNVVVTSATSNIVARIGSSTGDTAADWVSGDVVGAAPNFALSPTSTFPDVLRGARLNHIGSANNFAAAGLVVIQSSGNTLVTEGGASDSYTVALSSQPLADVIVTLTPDAQLSLGAGVATSIALTFTTTNWNVAQTVLVTGINDGQIEGQHTGVISHTIANGSAADYLALNVASTNVIVTINDPVAAAPILTSVVVNGADMFLNQAQRSMVTSLVVAFSGPVVLSPGAFSITNVGLYVASSIDLAQSQILVTPNATNDVYKIRFASGPGVNTRLGTGNLGNSLADGNYRLTIDSTKVSNAGGSLTGNNVFGAAAADNFFRLYGDANGDGRVDGVDLFSIRSALAAGAAYNAALDWDGNGSVSIGFDTSNFSANQNRRRRLF